MLIRNRHYYFWATYHRKFLDKLLEDSKHYYRGVVLDIGGRDRGRFNKPKDKVKRWIFADIEERHNPDIILNVCDMSKIASESIDVVNATEIFEHVENPEKGLEECYRVLKKDGTMILSVPFLFPIHADPYDYQRWTEEKWRKELGNLDFKIERFEIMGRYFTVLADMIKTLAKSFPVGLRHLFYFFYPLIDLIVKLDNLETVKKHSYISKFTTGYFAILRK